MLKQRKRKGVRFPLLFGKITTTAQDEVKAMPDHTEAIKPNLLLRNSQKIQKSREINKTLFTLFQ